MTNPKIPEEAVEPVAKAIYEAPHDGLSRNGYDAAPREIQDIYRAEARLAAAAALPHLRVQETPPWEGITSREPEGEALAQMRKWYADNDLPGPGGCRCTAPAPHPRPVVDREALETAITDALMTADDLILPGYSARIEADADDIARVAAPAVLALLPTEEGEGHGQEGA